MGIRVVYAEGFLRLVSLALTAVTALLLGLDRQTKQIIFTVERTADVRSLRALWVLTLTASAAAGYNLLQLGKCVAVAKFARDKVPCRRWEAWLCFALDQVAMYAVLATAASAMQGSLVAVVGSREMQWTKICNIYTRFCHQVGGGLVCAMGATAFMTMVSMLSSQHLVQLYPSNRTQQQQHPGKGATALASDATSPSVIWWVNQSVSIEA